MSQSDAVRIRRSADGSVCFLCGGPPDSQVVVQFPTGSIDALCNSAGTVTCTPPLSRGPVPFAVRLRAVDSDASSATLARGVLEADPPVIRGSDGRLLCTPPGVCPPDVTGVRCCFPGGDAPEARCDADGAVSCRPAASSSKSAFRVIATCADGRDLALGEGVMAAPVTGMRAFVSVSLCYLLFTTTDGALRMVVLFYAFTLGFSAWDVALMFSLYELAGVATNLLAGVAGARWGIKSTLLCGLCVQLAGICMLFGFRIAWVDPGAHWKVLAWIAAANGVGGIAKDLVKLGGKTVSKLVTPDEKQSRLFAVVAWLTGMKNSLKGVGYFIGAASLSVSLEFALALNLALICLALPIAALGLPRDVGRARSRNLSLRAILVPAQNVQRLSFARAFLFGSRDLWFEVVLPFYMRDAVQGLGWSRFATGAFLAAFIIVYGQIQTATPRFILSPLRQEPANKLVQVLWNAVLTGIPLVLTLLFATSEAFLSHELASMEGAICSLLTCFCVVFAINSSIHSYLIVRYSAGDKVAADIGFYYMSNAAGRFIGTLLSGALYEWSAGSNKTAAMGWCFLSSTIFSLISALLTTRIDDQQAGLLCGRWTLFQQGGHDEQSRRGLEEGHQSSAPATGAGLQASPTSPQALELHLAEVTVNPSASEPDRRDDSMTGTASTITSECPLTREPPSLSLSLAS
jgi:hypothetical protein